MDEGFDISKLAFPKKQEMYIEKMAQLHFKDKLTPYFFKKLMKGIESHEFDIITYLNTSVFFKGEEIKKPLTCDKQSIALISKIDEEFRSKLKKEVIKEERKQAKAENSSRRAKNKHRLLKINGFDVMQTANIKSSPLVGNILNLVDFKVTKNKRKYKSRTKQMHLLKNIIKEGIT